MPNVDFDAYIEPDDEARIRPASEFLDEAIEFFEKPELFAGLSFPWRKTFGKLAFRPGELSLWSGINGHGKSHMLTQLALWWLRHGKRVVICSLEVKPFRTFAYQSRQAIGVEKPAKPWMQAFAEYSKQKLWYYDQIGTVAAPRMIGVARYAIQELGVDHVVIDSLLKCGMGEDDYNMQKDFADRLAVLARDTNANIHLACHSRKTSDESKVMDKFDIRGSSALSDLADNVYTVWRNKAKEENPDKYADSHDAVLGCSKQKNGEWEGRIGLWFHRQSQTYTEHEGRRMEMLPELESANSGDCSPTMNEPF